jgi:uncharacterized lipoprotein
MRNALLTTALATLAACTSSPNYWRAYTPASGTSSSPKATLIQKATLAVVDAGYETEISDANTGLVVTKWFQGTGMTSEDNRFRLRVTVDDAGRYEVTAQCQEKATGPMSGGGWNDHCSSEDKRPQFVLDAVARVERGMK